MCGLIDRIKKDENQGNNKLFCLFFSRKKKDEDQGKEKCHDKSMMSNDVNERIKRDTQDVPLRQSAEEKVRGTGLKAVWDDTNE